MRTGIPFRISVKLHSKLKKMSENFTAKTGKPISMVKMSEMIADNLNEDVFSGVVTNKPLQLKRNKGWPF